MVENPPFSHWAEPWYGCSTNHSLGGSSLLHIPADRHSQEASSLQSIVCVRRLCSVRNLLPLARCRMPADHGLSAKTPMPECPLRPARASLIASTPEPRNPPAAAGADPAPAGVGPRRWGRVEALAKLLERSGPNCDTERVGRRSPWRHNTQGGDANHEPIPAEAPIKTGHPQRGHLGGTHRRAS
jgi:hypothetical protein